MRAPSYGERWQLETAVTQCLSPDHHRARVHRPSRVAGGDADPHDPGGGLAVPEKLRAHSCFRSASVICHQRAGGGADARPRESEVDRGAWTPWTGAALTGVGVVSMDPRRDCRVTLRVRCTGRVSV